MTTIFLREISSCEDLSFPFIERLLTDSFPKEEYRPLNAFREYTDKEDKFHILLIVCNGQDAGFFTYWNFDSFCYIEHFAIDTPLRNLGIGHLAINLLKQHLKSSIVLEVELPVGEIEKRRISFYERNGFRLCAGKYMQPPYRKGDKAFPLCLMVTGDIDMEADFKKVVRNIHQSVYDYRDDLSLGEADR